MANPLQQQALRRKVIYIGLILVLFTAAFFFRTNVVEAYARKLSLREQDRADVELTGRAVQLTLTGLRGVAVTILWSTAIDKQKKNQWNELELLVRSVTKLQPHFITPWLFQSWNLAYNVSVESDREYDQYFYISRGIELLYEGERQNKNHPDMRFAMAHYTMNKIAQGDKKNVLMALFNLSCMDPRERDPARFRKLDEHGRPVIDLVEFENFCRKHPQLVRRLRGAEPPPYGTPPEWSRQRLRLGRPEDIVRFLERNEKLPSLYQAPRPDRAQTPLKPPGQRFPLLPPRRDRQFSADALHDQTNIDEHVDYIDAFLVAHAWFAYSQEALAEPDPEIPGKSRNITDRTRQRTPKMTTLIFRMFPARAMHYFAERLENDGWFDQTGWSIDERDASRSQRWFPDRESVVVGDRLNWGVHFWAKTHDMWHTHGEDNHLVLSLAAETDLNNRARRFREVYSLTPEDWARNLRESDLPEDLRDGYKAHTWLREFEYYRKQSNFPHFYFVSEVEAKPETVLARKRFFEAERLRLLARNAEALEKYEEKYEKGKNALEVWKDLLNNHADFQKDDIVQEETLDIQQKYLDLVKKLRGPEIKRELALLGCLSPAAGGPPYVPLGVWAMMLDTPRLLPDLVLAGPFDGKAKNGEPFIRPEIRQLVRNRNQPARPAGTSNK